MFIGFTGAKLVAVGKFGGEQKGLDQLLDRFAAAELAHVVAGKLDVIGSLLRSWLALENQHRELFHQFPETDQFRFKING